MNYSKKTNTTQSAKSNVEIAFHQLENVFLFYKNKISDDNNRHPIGDPDRTEHDLLEFEKAHLDLLTTQVNVEISKNSSNLANQLNLLTKCIVILAAITLFFDFLKLFNAN